MSTTTTGMTSRATGTRSGPIDPIGADLVRTLKDLKLGQMTRPCPNGWSWPGSRR